MGRIIGATPYILGKTLSFLDPSGYGFQGMGDFFRYPGGARSEQVQPPGTGLVSFYGPQQFPEIAEPACTGQDVFFEDFFGFEAQDGS